MGLHPLNGKLIPYFLRSGSYRNRWCPNTGVMRLDPCSTYEERKPEVEDMLL